VESATENLDWVKNYGSEIESWLKSRSQTTQPTTDTPTNPGEASSVSLSPVLCMSLFFSFLHQILTTLK
jgi:hypothetical protein